MGQLEYFCCFNSYRRRTRNLSDSELGRLFRALMLYNETGERAQLNGREETAFDFIVDEIDAAKKAYESKCEKNRQNRTNDNDRQRSSTNDNDRAVSSTKDKGQRTKDECIYDDDYACAREEYVDVGMQKISELYQANIGMITPVISTGLREYREKMSDDVICKAIEAAAANQARSWSYIRAILSDKESKGITTLDKWNAAETERKRGGKVKGKSLDDILDELE